MYEILRDLPSSEDEKNEDFFEGEDQALPKIPQIVPTRGPGHKIDVRRPYHVLQESFFGLEPYNITLFQTRPYLDITQELLDAKTEFNKCENIHEAFRISRLCAISEHFSKELSLKKNSYGMPRLIVKPPYHKYEPSVLVRLTLDHLFAQSVDRFLKTYGIVERKNGLILVSIPGEMRTIDGKVFVGYFQYSFIPKTGKCIHRYFAAYTANNPQYISGTLRKALLNFLIEHKSEDPEYRHIIRNLQISSEASSAAT